MSSGLEIESSQVTPSWNNKRVWLNLSSIGISSMYFGNATRPTRSNNRNRRKASAKKNKKKNNASTTNKESIKNSTKKQSISSDDDDDISISDDDSDDNEEVDEEFEEERQQYKYKSSWLRHMMLDSRDTKSDPPGIKVRPIEGIEGVDYLTPGPITSHISYVFGPVIKALVDSSKAGGYTPDVNLRASTYDWRLCPRDMERRDKYFTKTKLLIEEMYQQNNQTPVVLLAHSLGCKVCHYFLNFVKQHHFGQHWINRHIHTFMPVGGPHLGAPKACRAVVSGDKMGLDTFLNDDEAVGLGRSWGSSPWLVPSNLPRGVPATNYIRPHGVLELSFTNSVDTDELVCNRTAVSRPKRYQLQVKVTGLFDNDDHDNSDNKQHELKTPFYKINRDLGDNVVVFPDKLSFVTSNDCGGGGSGGSNSKSSSSSSKTTIQFFLQEPGFASAKKEKGDEKCCKNPWVWCVCCCCIPCMLAYKIIEGVLRMLVRATTITADKIVGSAGNSTTLAFSEQIRIPKAAFNNNVASSAVTIRVPLYHTDDYRQYHNSNKKCFSWLTKRRKPSRQTDLIVKIKWYKFDREKSFRQICGPICVPSKANNERSVAGLPIVSSKKLSSKSKTATNSHRYFEEFTGYDLFEREGLRDSTLQFVRDAYDSDPFGPRGKTSAEDPPPVSRIHAIYGVNLPTEIGCVYKRQDVAAVTSRRSDQARGVRSLYVPDKKSTILSSGDDNDSSTAGYKISNGIILETSKTKQIEPMPFGTDDTDDGVICQQHREISGDGTVPYWSLAHSKTWNGAFIMSSSTSSTSKEKDDSQQRIKVTVEELDGAPHREILADPRFHDAVIRYVRSTIHSCNGQNRVDTAGNVLDVSTGKNTAAAAAASFFGS